MNVFTNDLKLFWSISAFIISVISTGASGQGYGFPSRNDEISVDELLESAKNIGSVSILLKAPEDCETPDKLMGFCVEIKSCPVLLEQLINQNARKFLTSSKCGAEDDDATNPKVCCGKYGNFKNLTTSNQERSIKVSSVTHTGHHDKILPKDCGKVNINLHGRIFGGKKADLGEFPWMARLLHKNKKNEKNFGCSGFLIHSRYVLTAGHCVHKKFITFRGPVHSVVLGEHDIRTKVDCVKGKCAEPLNIRKAVEVIIHPEYDPEHEAAHYNDVALILLNSGAKITDFVRPICLNRDTIYIPPEYTLSGWGKTEKEIVSSVKMKVNLPAVNWSECEDQYSFMNISLRETQICAGGEKGKDSCSGDSGGPLMFFGENNSWYAAGIVSFGIGCGAEGWPGVYTNIPYFVQWIQNTIFDGKSKWHVRNKNGTKTE